MEGILYLYVKGVLDIKQCDRHTIVVKLACQALVAYTEDRLIKALRFEIVFIVLIEETVKNCVFISTVVPDLFERPGVDEVDSRSFYIRHLYNILVGLRSINSRSRVVRYKTYLDKFSLV